MSVFIICFFNEIQYIIDFSCLSSLVHSVFLLWGANTHNMCDCLCSRLCYICLSFHFPLCFQFCVCTISTVLCAIVTLWICPLGVKELPINPFLCCSRILRCICECGWHQEEWTPAVWYLEQDSECIIKSLFGITVIAHQGTLSFHYIKQFDRVILSGQF